MTSALIVIDVQRALFETNPAPADAEAEAVLARINALAGRAADIAFAAAAAR
ncbi:hypothetical protein LMG26854_03759 [Achromobacter aegrifaciens]|uniref:hypothetical protein n=1 Tax=Achromobacter aegrifaciens TaxID=1287736 RepID=UPI0014678CD6|nr:hypothetical protein [Achromobacter aegrifaciens]CAB3866664.1 hypothetical protein LMG26854_03759 [Achromobacter aegrifaciens]